MHTSCSHIGMSNLLRLVLWLFKCCQIMPQGTVISLTVAAMAKILCVLSRLKDTGEKKCEYTP